MVPVSDSARPANGAAGVADSVMAASAVSGYDGVVHAGVEKDRAATPRSASSGAGMAAASTAARRTGPPDTRSTVMAYDAPAPGRGAGGAEEPHAQSTVSGVGAVMLGVKLTVVFHSSAPNRLVVALYGRRPNASLASPATSAMTPRLTASGVTVAIQAGAVSTTARPAVALVASRCASAVAARDDQAAVPMLSASTVRAPAAGATGRRAGVTGVGATPPYT